MKDTKYKILAYFDNQSYRKLFNEINSDYAENLQILLHNLSLFSYDIGYKFELNNENEQQ